MTSCRTLVFRSTPTDRTVVEALIEAAKVHGKSWPAIEDPVSGRLTYRRLLQAVAILGAKLMPFALEGRPLGVMLPTSNGGVVTVLAVMSGGRVPAMINFSAGAANILGACRAAEVDTILTSRVFVEKGRLDNLVAQLEKSVRIVYLEDIRKTIGTMGQDPRPVQGRQAAGRAQARRLGRDPVHVRHRRPAQGRRAVTPQRAHQRRPVRGPDRFRPRRQGVQRAADLPLVRLHRRRGAAADFRRTNLPLSVAAALSHRSRTGLRHMRDRAVRHRYIPQRLCAHGQSVRFPLSALRRGRRRAGARIDAEDLSGKVRPAHSRRVRLDRDLPGAGAEHADVQQIR